MSESGGDVLGIWLSESKRLAEAATAGEWRHDRPYMAGRVADVRGYEVTTDNLGGFKAGINDAVYIASLDPSIQIRVLEVVRAAQEVHSAWFLVPMSVGPPIVALDTALDALREAVEKR